MTDEQKPNEPLPTEPPPSAAEGQPAPPVGATRAAASAPSTPIWGAPPPPPPPPSWYQAAPPAIPPPPPPRRDRAALAVVLFVFGGLFVVFFGFLLLAYSAVRGETPRLSTGPRIGVVEVKGEIGAGRGSVDAQDTLKVIKRFLEDADMKAVVVRIDSPGGAVAPSQEIYDEIRKLAEKKTVVCSMGNLAASGGFYVAMGCPHILAEPGTLTGSIGVISMFPNVKGLADRFNVKMETVKSGKLKDAGSPFRDMTPEDRAYWQSLVNQVYAQFLQAVVDARELPEEQVRRIADGRVITGQQAQELGLIDELGNFNDAVDAAKEQAGLAGEPRLVYPPEERSRFLEELMSGAVHSAADAIRAEVHRETASAGTPGLYYMAR